MHYIEAENAAYDGAGDDPNISPFTRIAYHSPNLTAPFPSEIDLLSGGEGNAAKNKDISGL